MCVGERESVCVCEWVYIHMHKRIHMFAQLHVYMHAYTYIHTHTYTHYTCIHTQLHTQYTHIAPIFLLGLCDLNSHIFDFLDAEGVLSLHFVELRDHVLDGSH
jgi:hypothetical protein